MAVSRHGLNGRSRLARLAPTDGPEPFEGLPREGHRIGGSSGPSTPLGRNGGSTRAHHRQLDRLRRRQEEFPDA
jgi:hypothetical protein